MNKMRSSNNIDSFFSRAGWLIPQLNFQAKLIVACAGLGALVLIFSIIAAVLSVLAANFLINRKTFSSFVSGLMACLFFTLIGAVSSFIGLIASVGLVSALR